MPNVSEALLRWHRAISAVVGLSGAQDDFVLARLSKAIVDAGAPRKLQEALERWPGPAPTILHLFAKGSKCGSTNTSCTDGGLQELILELLGRQGPGQQEPLDFVATAGA